jgi:hypothetical protein
MPLIIEDLQKFSRDAEDYVHTVIVLAAANEDELEAAAVHVVGRLSDVLEAMFEGIAAADAAQALGQPLRQFPALRN